MDRTATLLRSVQRLERLRAGSKIFFAQGTCVVQRALSGAVRSVIWAVDAIIPGIPRDHVVSCQQDRPILSGTRHRHRSARRSTYPAHRGKPVPSPEIVPRNGWLSETRSIRFEHAAVESQAAPKQKTRPDPRKLTCEGAGVATIPAARRH